MMRTTITLDPDVARDIEEKMARDDASFKTVVNDALRRGLTLAALEPAARYEVQAFDAPIAAGVDPTKVNQLLDAGFFDDEIVSGRIVSPPDA